jgi:hypothetical protein
LLNFANSLAVERVRGGAQPHHRLAGFEVRRDVLQLVVRQREEPREDDKQVRVLQRFETGHVVDGRVDSAVFRVHREQHGAFEPVVLRQNLGELRDRFFGAVLLIAAEQHDVLALPDAVAAGQHDGLVVGARRAAEREQGDESE